MTDNGGMLSVVVPAFNEAEMVEAACAALAETLQAAAIPYELIFVDDGSTDATWAKITACATQDARVRGIAFSRNFGKESAIFAGLSEAKGACCCVIDCDLQHPPEAIPEMYARWREGYQVVEGKKAHRGRENIFHRLFAKLFYRLISGTTGVDMARASDFKLLDRLAVDALLSMPEQHIFFRALSAWVGFSTTSVDYLVQPRTRGNTKWSAFSLTKYAIRNIASFSTAPMQVITVCGLAAALLALILGIQALVKWAMGTAQEGFTTVILLILIIGALLMVSLGIIGYYIARIYDEVRGRPKYILARRTDGAAVVQHTSKGE